MFFDWQQTKLKTRRVFARTHTFDNGWAIPARRFHRMDQIIPWKPYRPYCSATAINSVAPC